MATESNIISLYNVHPPWRESEKVLDIIDALKGPKRRSRERAGGREHREAGNHPRGAGGARRRGGNRTVKASIT